MTISLTGPVQWGRFIEHVRSIHDIRLSKYFSKIGVPVNSVKFDKRTGMLHIKQLGLDIPPDRFNFILEGLRYCVPLVERAGARFYVDSSRMMVEIDSIIVEVRTLGELGVLWEIFVTGMYDYHIKGGCVIVDIGMNVGYASLYFSRFPDSIVYGFEPFKSTFEQAMKNISMNSMASKKIVPLNRGIGGSERKMTVEFCEENSESNGIFGPTRKPSGKLEHEEITLLDSSIVLSKIITENHGKKIIIKMDCEGAEYEILERLIETGLIDSVDAFLMEWHNIGDPDGKNTLTKALLRHHFGVLAMPKEDKVTGLIYATKIV